MMHNIFPQAINKYCFLLKSLQTFLTNLPFKTVFTNYQMYKKLYLLNNEGKVAITGPYP